jgi:HK97 family phage portal protein
MVWPFTRREVKEHPAGAAFYVAGAGAWQKPQNRRAFVEEGYQLNVIVYRAVQEITRSLADLAIEVARGEDVADAHPALTLLARPNPTQGWDAFIGEAFTNFELTGELAIVRYPETGRVAELWSLNPLYISVEPGTKGIPKAYVYEQGGTKIRFPVNPLTGQSQLFFHKTYNPMNYWRGQAPLEAAGLAADTHNAGMRWNYSLLKNSARPSGLVKLEAGTGPEVVARIKEWFKRAMQGDSNAGEIPVLPGGADWVPMDNNPRDMDFLSTQKETAKMIAAAFGVPMPLIDNDSAKFDNYQTARESFYTDTIIPKFNSFLASFGNWLLPAFGEGLQFRVDEDRVAALEPMRGRKFDRMVKAVMANILTIDEARVAIGYDPRGGAADELDPLAGVAFPADQAKALGYGA